MTRPNDGVANCGQSISGFAIRRAGSSASAGARPGPAPVPAITYSSRPWSRAWAVIPSRPISVRPASSASRPRPRWPRSSPGTAGRAPVSHDHPRLDRSPRIPLAGGRESPRLPVEKAMKRSPEPLDAMSPSARGQAGTLGEPLALVGEHRGVRRQDDDDRAAAGPGPGGHARPRRRPSLLAGLDRPLLVPRARDLGSRDLLAHRHAVDPEQLARPVVRLDERAHGPAAVASASRATRCRSRP